MASYFAKSFFISLISFAPLMPIYLASAIIKNLNYQFYGLSIAIAVIGTIATLIIFIRLSSILPSTALDQSYSIHDAIGATKGQTLTIAGAFLLLLFLLMPFELILAQFERAPALIALTCSTIWEFVKVIIFLSFTTTLYSQYIKKCILIPQHAI